MEERTWYEFVYDDEAIKQFANLFNLTNKNLAMCIYLMARRKYFPQLSEKSIIVNRGIVCGGERFVLDFHKTIVKMETRIGTYEDGDVPIPNNAFAIYAIINPKDTFKALSKTMLICAESISDGDEMPNAYKTFRVQLPKANIKGDKFRQIDLDTKNIDEIKSVSDLFNSLNFKPEITVETRGGFHIVYNTKIDNIKEIHRRFYEFKNNTLINNKRIKDYWFSITNETMSIVPGTFQGGFKTRVITIDDWLFEKGVGF